LAITPPSDIVLDVARAADPTKYKAAVERLARLRATNAGEGPPAAQSEPPAASPFATSIAREQASTTAGFAPAARQGLDPYAQFEAFVLQSFIQSMLPKNAPGVFGKGLAGDVWKSMLAEKLGSEMARSGRIGIATRLASRETAMPAPTVAAAAPASSALLGALAYLTPEPADRVEAAGATPPVTPAERS
jgi:Rod binding domain-containing protein